MATATELLRSATMDTLYNNGPASAYSAEAVGSEQSGSRRDKMNFFDYLFNPFTGKVDYASELDAADYQNKIAAESAAAANVATWEREDTYLDRMIAAYKRNGLNPYAAIAGSSSPLTVGSSSAKAADVASVNYRGIQKDILGTLATTALTVAMVFGAVKGLTPVKRPHIGFT